LKKNPKPHLEKNKKCVICPINMYEEFRLTYY
jgi:hypothetical protein